MTNCRTPDKTPFDGMSYRISWPDIGLENYLEDLGMKKVHQLDEAAILVVPGGQDIDPTYYGKENEGSTGFDIARDKVEGELIHLALGMGTPVVGICRGAQLLCVMSGGGLIQHNPSGYLSGVVETEGNGQVFEVLVDHHQVLIPDPEEHDVYLKRRSGVSDLVVDDFRGFFMFQPHPEWGHHETDELFRAYLQEFLEEWDQFDDLSEE